MTIIMSQYILCPILYIHIMSYTLHIISYVHIQPYTAIQHNIELQTAIQGYKQQYRAINS